MGNLLKRGTRGQVVLTFLLVLLGVIVLSACSSSAPSPIATVQLLSPDAYYEQFGGGQTHVLIDVRTPEEFASGHIQRAIDIPVEELPDRLSEVPQDIPIVVYCRTGNRSATAAQILVKAGFAPVFDLGGIQSWVAAGYPVTR